MQKPSPERVIYKIVSADAWAIAEKQSEFRGAEIDIADGYIHFSTADQVVETVAKHFAGQHGLLLVGVKDELLGRELRWEKARNGDLFPHLYGPLSLDDVDSVIELSIGKAGSHLFPNDLGISRK